MKEVTPIILRRKEKKNLNIKYFQVRISTLGVYSQIPIFIDWY